jgi:hypothetical protein
MTRTVAVLGTGIKGAAMARNLGGASPLSAPEGRIRSVTGPGEPLDRPARWLRGLGGAAL